MPSRKKKVGRIPAASEMLTPGSYRLSAKTTKGSRKGQDRLSNTPDKGKRAGRPIMKVKKKKARKDIIHRNNYTERDMKEAIRLVQEEEMTIIKAAGYINDTKKNPVPRNVGLKNLAKECSYHTKSGSGSGIYLL